MTHPRINLKTISVNLGPGHLSGMDAIARTGILGTFRACW